MPPPRFIYVDPKFLSYHGFSLVCDHNLAAEAITSQQLQELNNRLQQLLEFSQISSGQPMNQPYRKHTPTRAGGGSFYQLLLVIRKNYLNYLPRCAPLLPSTSSIHSAVPPWHPPPAKARQGRRLGVLLCTSLQGRTLSRAEKPEETPEKMGKMQIYKHENLVYKYLQFLFHHLHSRIWWFKYRDVCIWLHHGEPWSPLFPIQSC